MPSIGGQADTPPTRVGTLGAARGETVEFGGATVREKLEAILKDEDLSRYIL